jgi:transposase
VSLGHARRVRQYLRERGTLEPKTGKTGYAPAGSRPTSSVARGTWSTRRAGGDPRQALRDRLGVTVDVRTVRRWLAKAGLVLKKSRSAPPSRTAPT